MKKSMTLYVIISTLTIISSPLLSMNQDNSDNQFIPFSELDPANQFNTDLALSPHSSPSASPSNQRANVMTDAQKEARRRRISANCKHLKNRFEEEKTIEEGLSMLYEKFASPLSSPRSNSPKRNTQPNTKINLPFPAQIIIAVVDFDGTKSPPQSYPITSTPAYTPQTTPKTSGRSSPVTMPKDDLKNALHEQQQQTTKILENTVQEQPNATTITPDDNGKTFFQQHPLLIKIAGIGIGCVTFLALLHYIHHYINRLPA